MSVITMCIKNTMVKCLQGPSSKTVMQMLNRIDNALKFITTSNIVGGGGGGVYMCDAEIDQE